jgi:hypothetical protein
MSASASAAADSNVRTFTVDRKYLKVSVKQPVAMRRSRGGGEAAPVLLPAAPESLASQTRVSEVIQTAGNAVAASPDALTVRMAPAPAISGNGGMGGSVAPTQAGGSGISLVNANTRVILGGKKKRTNVLLSHKRNRQPTVQIPATATAIGGGAASAHKKTRKITIKLQGLKRRMTKARKTARMSKTLPISHIRKELMDRKLIKASSKAPEGILRAMYTDAKIVANKSL